MKPKNIMLLGFVNRAVEYIDKHMDEEPDARLAELKNIDLASIKDELADNLDLSLGTMQSTMSTLLKAGNEAFDRFIENHGQRSFYDEINNIFDEDKDKQKEEEDSALNNQDKLASLLSFYNLEDDFDIEEESEEEKHVEENSNEEVVENKEETEEEVKENKEEVVEEETEYELSPEDHELMKEIAKNASSDDDTRPLPLHYDKKTNEDIDSIFNEIIENENNDKVEDEIEPSKENNEDNGLVDQLLKELPPIDTTLIDELLDKIISVKDDNDIDTTNEPKQEEVLPNDDNNDVLGNSELIQNIIESSLNQEEEVVEEVKETEQPLTEEINDVNSSEIVENIIENTLNQKEDINDNSEELIVEDDTNEEVSSADEDTNIPEDTAIQNEDINDDNHVEEQSSTNEDVNDSIEEEEPIEENEFINDFNDYLGPVYAHEVIENPLVDIHFDEPVEEEETIADEVFDGSVNAQEVVAGKVIENPLVDINLEEPIEEETVDIVEPAVEEDSNTEVIEENVNETAKEEEEITDTTLNETVDIEEPVTGEDSNAETIEEDVNNEVESEEKVEETVKDTNNNDKPYVSTLLDDLKKQLETEAEIKKQKEEKNKEIYDRISRMYPYLSKSFVKTVFDLKEDFARDYSNGQKVVVLHRIKFMNVDNLRQFAEIALNHDYLINVDENKLIVDIFKQFDNSDGKILANIYEIANQGCLLNGTYEGYNVIINE